MNRKRASRRTSAPTSRRQPLLERLEERTVLAGNVAASISNGNLRLTGDSGANEIMVQRTGASSLLISSLDGTTINGQAGPLTLNGFTRGIVANMGSGDDVLQFDGDLDLFRVFGNVSIDMGAGNDDLIFENFSAWENLNINMGSGDDRLLAGRDLINGTAGAGWGLRVGKNTVINTVGGADTVALAHSDFINHVVMNTGTENDQVTLRETRFRKNLVINGNLGFDRLNSAGNTFGRRPVIVLFESQSNTVGPTASDDLATLNAGQSTIVNVAANDSGGGSTLDLTSIVITDPPDQGTAVANPDGTVTYTHNGSSTTSDSFRYTIADAAGTVSNEATVSLTVVVTNQNPTISDVGNQTTNEDTATAALAFTVGDAETAAGSLTVTGTSSNTTLVPNANIVIGGSGANRTVTITPVANQSGTATITLTVADGNGGTAADTFLLTVNAVNDPPTISNVADLSTPEDTPTAAIPFTIGDIDTDVNTLTVTGSSDNDTLIPDANVVIGGSGANRTVTITPAANQTGTATITLSVFDGTTTVTDTFVVTVTAVTDPPTISSVADLSTPEDTPTAAIPFTIGDIDTDVNTLTVTASSDNDTVIPDANVVIGGSGASRTVTITPAANQTGAATITLSVFDGTTTVTETFVVTVDPVNDPPTISDVVDQSTDENTPTAAIPFTVGDIDTDVATLTVTGSSDNDTLVPDANVVIGGSGANRTVTITPAANQSGTATITLSVFDGTTTVTDTFVVTVDAANEPPTISDVADLSTPEETPTAAIPFTIGDPDTDVNTLTVTASSDKDTLIPDASVVIGGTGASRTVTITPAANQTGTATITLSVFDGTTTVTDTFVVTVTPVNDPPVTADDTDAVTENSGVPAVSNVLTNDTDGGDGAALTVAEVAGDSGNVAVPVAGTYGTFQINADGTYTYTLDDANATVNALAGGVTLTDSITYTVSDGTDTATATLTVTITGANDAPVAVADAALVAEGAAVINIDVAGNDTDVDGTVDPATVTITVNGTNGTATVNPDGTINYIHDGSNTTTDEIRYTIEDDAGGISAEGVLTITVTAVNDVPVATDDVGGVTENAGTPLTGNVITNDTDGGDGAALAITEVNGAGASVGTPIATTYGTIQVNADGTFTYTLDDVNVDVNDLADGETLADVITYTLSDGTDTDTATLTITITGAADSPVATDDIGAVTEDTGLAATGNVLTNDNDGGDGTALEVTAVAGGTVGSPIVTTYGTFQIDANGDFTYTLDDANVDVSALATGATLTDSITYTVSDGTGTTPDTATLTITITGANDPPVATVDAATATEGSLAFTMGNVLLNDSDGTDGGPLSVTEVNGSASGVGSPVAGLYGTFQLDASGIFVYVLDSTNPTIDALNDGQTLTDSITYTVSDGEDTDTETLTVTIEGVTDVIP